jgi:lipid II:glycine glycyltransferase (peptidoglycan interpeptide bridge formation enzyme)
LTNAAIHLAYELDASQIEIRTFSSSSLIRDERFSRHNNYYTHSLQLDSNPTQLMASFHRSCVRQKIQQTIRNNVCLKRGENEADLQQFYKLYVMTRRRLGLPPQPYIFFKMIWETFSPANQVMLLIAEQEGKTVAGMLLFKFKGRVSAEFLASDLKYRSVHPDHFLFWEAIKLAYGEGYEFFDFGRTSLSNKTLAAFKNRWGTKEIDLPNYFYPGKNIANGFICEGSLRNRFVRGIFRHTPLTALKCVGNLYYRHCG